MFDYVASDSVTRWLETVAALQAVGAPTALEHMRSAYDD